MSSPDEGHPESNVGSTGTVKKRKLLRACDVCRRKKIKCDGPQKKGEKCSTCEATKAECTYLEAAQKRGPPKGYVEKLENRLDKMEKLLERICPNIDIAKELGDNLDNDLSFQEKFPRARLPSPSSSDSPYPPNYSEDPFSDVPEEDDYGHIKLNEHTNVRAHPADRRFFGKASSISLIKTAITVKAEFTGAETPKGQFLSNRRPEFWSMRPWEEETASDRLIKYNFPEDDFMHELVDLYFRYLNVYFPLLHRPTFERLISEGHHLENSTFGGLVLLVCSLGSRYSNDPRVFLEDSHSTHSCGWKWFCQVRFPWRYMMACPCLYDLQICALAAIYLQACSSPQAGWTLVGFGVRLAQEIGAHRRTAYIGGTMTPAAESWKRTFWVLVCLDRVISVGFGRPCAIQDEDYDVPFPIECDDEYWEHPDSEQSFKQPPEKPSTVSFFIQFIKLNQILAFTLRTLYCINKSKILLGFVGQRWEQHILTELDSAMNSWLENVPDHLRWDPNREHRTFFDQSAFLYSSYYHLQILVHRPFIPSPGKPSMPSYPSLALCTNAARALAHIINLQTQRSGSATPFAQVPAFTAAIILLLHIWQTSRSGFATDASMDLADVHKCMTLLRMQESRWHAAGRLRDVLVELAEVGDLPLPAAAAPSKKRELEGTSATSNPATASSPNSQPASEGSPRVYAGSRRLQGVQKAQSSTNVPHAPPTNVPLSLGPQTVDQDQVASDPPTTLFSQDAPLAPSIMYGGYSSISDDAFLSAFSASLDPSTFVVPDAFPLQHNQFPDFTQEPLLRDQDLVTGPGLFADWEAAFCEQMTHMTNTFGTTQGLQENHGPGVDHHQPGAKTSYHVAHSSLPGAVNLDEMPVFSTAAEGSSEKPGLQ